MKRILYLTFIFILSLAYFTVNVQATEKTSTSLDKLLTQQEVEERLQDTSSKFAYVKLDENAYKIYPEFQNKKSVPKELLKKLPTNTVLYFFTTSEEIFDMTFDVIKDLEKSGRLYDNSRYMGGRDDTDAGSEKQMDGVHKFWFMKIPRGTNVYNDGVDVGIGIGIGRRHRGGGIGIGW